MTSSPIEPVHTSHNDNNDKPNTNFTNAAHPPTATRSSIAHAQQQPAVKTRQCRYFNQSGNCRNGNNCPFVHDDSNVTSTRAGTSSAMDEASSSSALHSHQEPPRDRRQAVKQPPASRVVSRPVPHAQSEDPREFQLGQIRRRFSPKESRQAAVQLLDIEEGTLLQFKLTPTDPDFPFDITALDCRLSVPNQYPESPPSLRVFNNDIPRGFAANIESGFHGMVRDMPDATLLELMKTLDKKLEVFLSVPKAETLKIVPNKDTRHLSTIPSRSVEPAAHANVGSRSEIKASQDQHANTLKHVKNFTPEQKAEAAKVRELETRQLEARMGRLALYMKSGDGIAYTVPIEPRKPSEVPTSLRAVKAVQLFVPLLYPLEHCRVKLEGVKPADAEPVEKGFEMKVEGQKGTALMGHINYLAQNMHHLAKTRPIPLDAHITESAPTPPVETKGKAVEGHQDPEKSHIQYISRPLEWTIVDHKDASDSDSDDSYAYDTDESTDEEANGGVDMHEKDGQPSQAPAQNAERGTAISFPFIEIHGIEILEVVVLNISVKCERCKDTTSIMGLKNGIVKTESCKKCATPLSVTYRRELVHAHSVRVGFLDMNGCAIVDMLPSTFIPTCSRCSTSYPLPGIVSIRSEITRNVCRECHQTFTFHIPEIKFLRITSSTHLPSISGPRRKKETLGLVAGTELPRRGRCKHYTKSYRWFRFSCCQKVYPCDKCHDEGEEHAHEWANRMICGWCSREGNYRPEDCAVCHGTLVGKKGGGFWEGGKGTRDKVKMSRKDKRKFRKVGGAARKD